MNQNLVNALRQVIAERGEAILTDNSNLLFNLLSDLAPESEKERKRIRLALRCSAMEQLNQIKDEPENAGELFNKSVVFAADENDWTDEVAYDTMLTLFSAMFPDLSAVEIQNGGEAPAENGTAAAGAVSSSGYEYFDDDEGNDIDRTWALEFEEKDGGYYISKYLSFSHEDVVELPAVYKGRPVLGISDHVFSSCDISEIIISDSVEVIENCVFIEAKISQIKLSQSLRVIGQSAFSRANISTLSLPKSLEYIGDYAFSGLLLEKIVIPDSVKRLPVGLFDGCINLNMVTLPIGLEEIGACAFRGCSALKEIDIPDTVIHIQRSAFENTNIINLVLPKQLSSIDLDTVRNCTKIAVSGRHTEITYKPMRYNDFPINHDRRGQAHIICYGEKIPYNRSMNGVIVPFSLLMGSLKEIYCLVGSKAFIFAQQNGIPCYPLKDYQP